MIWKRLLAFFIPSPSDFSKICESGVTNSASGYGFTGEYQQDGLVYLRARHYAPGMGRFLTRDTWSGDASRPLSFNRWGYVEGNPIVRVDPTGHSYQRMNVLLWARQYDGNKKLPSTYIAGDGVTYDLFDYTNLSSLPYPPPLCTVFVSSALWEGGLRDNRPDPRGEGDRDSQFANYSSPAWWSKDAVRSFPGQPTWEWNSNYKVVDPDNPWINTESFHRFMTKGYTNFRVSTVLDIHYRIPQYYGQNSNLGTRKDAWEGTLTLAMKSGWVQEGDAVLYDYEGDGNWDHAALINSWANQTYHTTNAMIHCASLLALDPCACGIPKPRVIEKGGSILYGNGGRSIDNTSGFINRIKILHIE